MCRRAQMMLSLKGLFQGAKAPIAPPLHPILPMGGPVVPDPLLQKLTPVGAPQQSPPMQPAQPQPLPPQQQPVSGPMPSLSTPGVYARGEPQYNAYFPPQTSIPSTLFQPYPTTSAPLEQTNTLKSEGVQQPAPAEGGEVMPQPEISRRRSMEDFMKSFYKNGESGGGGAMRRLSEQEMLENICAILNSPKVDEDTNGSINQADLGSLSTINFPMNILEPVAVAAATTFQPLSQTENQQTAGECHTQAMKQTWGHGLPPKSKNLP